MPKALSLLVRSGRRHAPRQFHGSRHPEPAKPIVCCLYCRQTTLVHRTESSVALFFRGHVDLSRNRLVFAVNVILQPRFRHIADPRNPGKRHLFEQEFIDQLLGGLRDQFLLGGLDELATAGFALVILISAMDETVFNYVVRFTAWATWH
jgi:hypothetical protein